MGDKKDITAHPPITEADLTSLKALSFRDYLKSELRRGYLLENDEERYTARREKVYTFFKIPREIEKFVAYGFFQCADSFFFVFTFLPIRFTLALWALLTRPFRKVFGLYFSKNRRILKPAEIVDLLKGVMVLVCCYLMGYIDTSVFYHIIKTQSTIKLYLFFNMLEIADRLMSAFGQDTLDALFWTATEPRGRKREHFGVLFHLLIAMFYVALHSTIVLLQALTLNVAINSDNKGLLTIVISNNAYSDHSDIVARRMGFIPLPLGVVMYRILSQSIRLTTPASYLILGVGFLCLLSFRVLNGIIILGKACDLIDGAEKRRARNESVSDKTDKKSSNTCDKTSVSSVNSKKTLKVEVATSPIRGWSMPSKTSPSNERVQSIARSLEVSASVSASTSIVSTPSPMNNHPPTPSPMSVRSDSLDFLGESKKGLMANSMVNLSSVGINEGPFTPDVSRQYRLQHSLESITSADNSDVGEHSGEHQSSSSLPCVSLKTLSLDEQAERIQAVSSATTQSSGGDSSGAECAAADEVPIEVRKFKRPPFASCDSLRYRGSTDGDLL
ncbi:Protein TAPT1 [Chionoecetes opilio]|uniref:Protein TAPT1 n=1 Tax=Chionoecetes opilio TaxID=41210 RepID=A0A8J4YQ36_CHIOP|nr:Protein TAPT1 [Chionoecetes opilio]